MTYASRSLQITNEPALGGFRISKTTVNHRRWSVVMKSRKETKEEDVENIVPLIPDVPLRNWKGHWKGWRGDGSANYRHERNKSGLRLKFNEERGWPQVCVHF
ncbi:hypothetical protein K0M31_005935 [Melipona bicolor]|uniref:Uncharacterized protein n=1 Tax=Melipona bicolor TaxID=60889 RepID=A0AA40FV02_9HYME|nr:hypothetical protein K0M31_005935 [Melipona bicolor]